MKTLNENELQSLNGGGGVVEWVWDYTLGKAVDYYVNYYEGYGPYYTPVNPPKNSMYIGYGY